MSRPVPTVHFTEAFLNAVHSVDYYFQARSPSRGQGFVRELFDLIYNVVVPFPRAQPLFQPLCQLLPEREFRKLAFRRQYLAIYEVVGEQVRFVLFRHSSLDPTSGLAGLLPETS